MSKVFKVRFEAVFLVSHPKGPQMTIEAAAKYLKKSKDFVKRWVNRYRDTGAVDDEEKAGRPYATTSKDDKVITRIFEKNPTMTIAQAQKILREKGIEVSSATIRRRLKQSSLQQRSTILKPLLTPKNVERRLVWAQTNLERDWTNIIFTDESSFWMNSPIKRVWAKKNDKIIQRTVKHPLKVHVWGCFSYKGFGRLICFTENLTAVKMIKLYKKGLIPSAEKFFGEENDNWFLQEDNDPKHQSNLCQQWKGENGIKTIDWPSQSPDANPIENVWALMKNRLRGKRIKSKKHFIRTLNSIWKSFSTAYAENLVESCRKRCQAIIDNHGDWTPY